VFSDTNPQSITTGQGLKDSGLAISDLGFTRPLPTLPRKRQGRERTSATADVRWRRAMTDPGGFVESLC
jgi:hypothetical protein